MIGLKTSIYTHEAIKILPVLSTILLTILVDHEESILVPPARGTEVSKLTERHVSVHVIIVNVLEVYFVLTENHQKIGIIAHQMFRYTAISLTEINAVNVPMTTHAKIRSHVVLLFTRPIVENHYRLRFCILGSHHFLVLAIGVVADTLHILDNLAQEFVLVLVQGL